MPPSTSAPPPAPPPAPFTPPAAPPEPIAPSPGNDQDYSFITNPETPPERSFFQSLGGGSLAVKITLVTGAIVAVFILILILRALVGGGNLNTETLLTVAQDQQELIHLSDGAGLQAGISTDNKNFSATLGLSLSSSQSQLLSYLAQNHKKINQKQLGMKVSATTDEQLASAASSGTYNQTFKQVMGSQLDQYGRDLQAAYQKNTGKKGRALLSDSYNQAILLAKQLNTDN